MIKHRTQGVPAVTETVTVRKDGLRPACEAEIGLYLDGAVPVRESLASAWGCTEPAVAALRGACVHEHVKVKRFCAGHGQIVPADAIWLCRECAALGHDCPLTVEVAAS